MSDCRTHHERGHDHEQRSRAPASQSHKPQPARTPATEPARGRTSHTITSQRPEHNESINAPRCGSGFASGWRLYAARPLAITRARALVPELHPRGHVHSQRASQRPEHGRDTSTVKNSLSKCQSVKVSHDHPRGSSCHCDKSRTIHIQPRLINSPRWLWLAGDLRRALALAGSRSLHCGRNNYSAAY